MPKKIDTAGLKHFKGKENAMIAGKPESTNTATVAHAVGEYFYWKGVLHIVTAAIAVGGTIQTNTNVKPAVLADDVGALKESISNSGLFAFPLFENLFNFNESIIATHRNFDISKNHIKITGTLTSSFFRGVPLTGTNCRELILNSVADLSNRIDDNDFVEIKAINTIPFLKYAIIVTHNAPTSGLGEFTIVLATKNENNQLITKTISNRSSPYAYTLDDNTVAEAFQHGNLAVYLISRGIQDQYVEDITISFIPITNTSALTALTLEH